jgi:hypothetical protein
MSRDAPPAAAARCPSLPAAPVQSHRVRAARSFFECFPEEETVNQLHELSIVAAQLDAPALAALLGAAKALVAPTGIAVVGTCADAQSPLIFTLEARSAEEGARVLAATDIATSLIATGPDTGPKPAALLTALNLVRLAASLSETPDLVLPRRQAA